MRIGIDIDSTLHHYWDAFSAVVLERHGIHLPYENQETWHIEGLSPDEVAAVIAATHADPHVSDAVPYEGAVEAVNRWADEGHFIHITSHRSSDSHEVTTAWLDSIGLHYDDFHQVADDEVLEALRSCAAPAAPQPLSSRDRAA